MSRNFHDFNNFSFSGSHRPASSSRRRSSSAARDPYDVSGASAAFSGFSFGESRSSARRASSTHRDPFDSSYLSPSRDPYGGSYSRSSGRGPPVSYYNSSGGGSSSGRRSSSSRHGYPSGSGSGYGSTLHPPPMPTGGSRFGRREGVDLSNGAADFYDPFMGALGTGNRMASWTDTSLPPYRSASAYAREQHAPRYSQSQGYAPRTSVTDPPPYRSFDSRYGDAPMQYPPTRRPSHYGGGQSSSRPYDYYDKYR